MVVSPNRVRVAGLGAVAAGVVMVGMRLARLASDQTPVAEGLGPLSLTVLGLSFALAMIAAIALYIQPTERTGRMRSIGAACLAAGFGSLLAGSVLEARLLLSRIDRETAYASTGLALAIALNVWLLLLPVGFLLAGFGLTGLSRRLLLGVAAYQLVTPFVAGLLRNVVPVTAPLLGREASSIVLSIGVAAIGYALWSHSLPKPVLEPARSRS